MHKVAAYKAFMSGNAAPAAAAQPAAIAAQRPAMVGQSVGVAQAAAGSGILDKAKDLLSGIGR